jgi:hypothetical protein
MLLSRMALLPWRAKFWTPCSTIAGSLPTSERGSELPSEMARKVVPGPIACSTRSSQPVVTATSAAPRSMQSCAWKWLRLASGVATACTAAMVPAFQ